MLDLPFSFRLASYFRSSCTHDTISWVVFFSVFRIRTYKNSVLEIWKFLSFHFLLVKFVKICWLAYLLVGNIGAITTRDFGS